MRWTRWFCLTIFVIQWWRRSGGQWCSENEPFPQLYLLHKILLNKFLHPLLFLQFTTTTKKQRNCAKIRPHLFNHHLHRLGHAERHLVKQCNFSFWSLRISLLKRAFLGTFDPKLQKIVSNQQVDCWQLTKLKVGPLKVLLLLFFDYPLNLKFKM